MIDKKFFRVMLSTLTLIGFMLIGFVSVSSPGLTQEINISIKEGRLEIKQGDTEFSLGGTLGWNYDYFKASSIDTEREGAEWGGNSELRSADISLKSKINQAWQGKLKISFSDSGSEVDDAYLKFTDWDWVDMTIGQAKEPFGLEELTSSSDLALIERSMATSAFAAGRNPGLGLSGHFGRFTWAAGVYEAMDREGKRDTYALTGRLTFAPWEHRNSVLHLGLSGSMRDYDGEKYKIEERPEVHTAEEIITSHKTTADNVNLLGFEAIWIAGPLSLQGEHLTAFVKATTGGEDDVTYSGYYLQVSYFLTGQIREYKKGTLGGFIPNIESRAPERRRRSIKTKQKPEEHGALEMVARYSLLDAEDRDKGIKATNFSAGLNYYITKEVRLMGNYIKTSLAGDVKPDEDIDQAISLSVQYAF